VADQRGDQLAVLLGPEREPFGEAGVEAEAGELGGDLGGVGEVVQVAVVGVVLLDCGPGAVQEAGGGLDGVEQDFARVGVAFLAEEGAACSMATRCAARRRTAGARPPWVGQTLPPEMAARRQRRPVLLAVAVQRACSGGSTRLFGMVDFGR
jgi:hypothetical protein